MDIQHSEQTPSQCTIAEDRAELERLARRLAHFRGNEGQAPAQLVADYRALVSHLAAVSQGR